MPPPAYTPHRVGRNAVVSIDGTVVNHVSGSVRRGAAMDTVVFPDGYQRVAPTSFSASGDLTFTVPFGASTNVYQQAQPIALSITDGTNDIFVGTALISEISDSFANDGGWTYSISWVGHDEYSPGGYDAFSGA